MVALFLEHITVPYCFLMSSFVSFRRFFVFCCLLFVVFRLNGVVNFPFGRTIYTAASTPTLRPTIRLFIRPKGRIYKRLRPYPSVRRVNVAAFARNFELIVFFFVIFRILRIFNFSNPIRGWYSDGPRDLFLRILLDLT